MFISTFNLGLVVDEYIIAMFLNVGNLAHLFDIFQLSLLQQNIILAFIELNSYFRSSYVYIISIFTLKNNE